MRTPRRGSRWSGCRVAQRSVPATYMNPDASHDKRRAGQAALPLVYPVCGQRWSLRCGHLHHLTYQRFGARDVGELGL
jgi:hypothetical protein